MPKRSLARVNDVEEIVPGKVWKVRGRSELGDRDGYYIVKLVDLKGLKRYVCSCQDPSKPFSLRRAREGCSHIGAVIAYRRMKGEDRY
ncbi:MAG: hypothetical protein DRJ31_03310 [Candidatus Methanomethylicota archaeon]|uniref:SWIM-type domain-containing protein n=1 Tax=Thermoproteota archaeon TaxID=2056631 RepID=A0A497ENY2_9CREN|nr:MAG: hypothetical protein DRJ33_08520 [Candidatus Verstraetearchaeota archaeon]RLE49885.1 MAG: hypothetical protein DRJ31_03310 [Candidatus Verstraetearchaeota archaeon]